MEPKLTKRAFFRLFSLSLLPFLSNDVTSFIVHQGNPIIINRGNPGLIITREGYYLYPVVMTGTRRGTVEIWESNDGMNWKYVKDALVPGKNGWDRLSNPCVEYYDGRYYLYYSGHGNEDRTSIELALSNSPVGDFERYSDNPVLESGIGWDRAAVTDPYVRHYSDTGFVMTYTGMDSDIPGREFIGYATSSDGLTWKKSSENPLLGPGLEDAAHLRVNDTWYLYYTDRDKSLTRPIKRISGPTLTELSRGKLIIDTDRYDWSPSIRWDGTDSEYKIYWHSQNPLPPGEGPGPDVFWISLARSKNVP